MPEQDYSHRDIVDKLGVKPGHAVAFVDTHGEVDADLHERVLARAGRGAASKDERPDMVLAPVDSRSNVVELLREWKGRITPDGVIWLLSPKRGLPGYVSQNALIAAGLEAGLVDNKSCSVSDTVSGLRLCFRRADRPRG